MESLRLEKTWNITNAQILEYHSEERESKFLYEASLDKTPPINGHFPALWAWTPSTCSLTSYSAPRLACGKFSSVPPHSLNNSSAQEQLLAHAGTMAKDWPHCRSGRSTQGATYPLGWKHKALLFPSGNRKEPAKLGPLLLQVGVYRGLFSRL